MLFLSHVENVLGVCRDMQHTTGQTQLNRRQGNFCSSLEDFTANHVLMTPGEILPTKVISYQHLLYDCGEAFLHSSFSFPLFWCPL